MADSDTMETEKKRPRDSSDDEDEKDDKDSPIQSRLRAKKSRATNIYSSSEEEISDDDKKKKTKQKKKTLTKKSRRASSEDDVEEGELSDEDDANDKFTDGYDADLLGDEADRAHLASLSEREREEEIFRRLEHRQALQRRAELEKKLRRRANESSKGNKSHSKAVDETSARSKERRLMVEGKKDVRGKAIENLKAAREEKKSKAAEVEKKKVADVKAESKSGSDSDDEDEVPNVEKKKAVSSSSDSDSDSDSDGRKSSEKDLGKEPVDNCEDLDKIRLSRNKLLKFMYLPFLSDTVKGAFVKVNFGDKDDMAQPVYRIAEVIGVGECSQPYSIPDVMSGSRPRKTQLILKLKFVDRERGEKEREIALTFISNNAFVEKEFVDFKERLNTRELPLPTRGHLEKKTKDFDYASNYRMTDEDITRMVEIKRKYDTKPLNIAMRKAELLKKKGEALACQDLEEASTIQRELDELNAIAEKEDILRLQNQKKIGQINQRNKTAMWNELETAMKTQADKRVLERGADDPFTRRWGTPTMVHKKVVKESTPGNSASKVGNGNNSADGKNGTSASADKPAENSSLKSDPFNMHNFDIGINIDLDEFPPVQSVFSRRSK